MPWPILAHQAPVLPLKLWRPGAFNGTALVIGSIAPDFEYLGAIAPTDGAFPHSAAGQFLFCLPITVALVILVGWLRLGAVVSARLGGRFGWLAHAATDVATPGGLFRASGSALIGSCSHVALDEVTHTWLPFILPVRRFHLGALVFGTTAICQLSASGGGALVALLLLSRLARRSRDADVAPKRGVWVIALLATLGGALGVLGARPMLRAPDAYFDVAPVYVWGAVAFEVLCGAGAGVLLGAIALRARDRIDAGRAREPRPALAGPTAGSSTPE